MSVTDYEAIVPHLFPDPNAKPEKEEVMPPARPKGFIDIVEYHKGTLYGPEVRIIPTKQVETKRNARKSVKTRTYEDYTLVLRRTWVSQKHESIFVRLELEIQSEELCKELRKIAISIYEETNLQSVPIKLKSPFSELFFYRDQIKAISKNETHSPELRYAANVLHDFIQDNGLLSSIIADYEKYCKEGQVVSDILWTIYPPNSLILVNTGKIQECWICRKVVLMNTPYQSSNSWEVSGFRIGFDGSSAGLVRQTFSLPMTKLRVYKISDLPVVPINHCKSPERIRELLTARSMRLQRVLGKNLASFSSQSYKGATWDYDSSEYDMETHRSANVKRIDGRVIVDFKAFIEADNKQLRLLEDFGNHLRNEAKIRKTRVKPRGIINERDVSPSRPEFDSDEPNVIFNPETDDDPMNPKRFLDRPEIENSTEPILGDLSSLSKAVTDSFNISDEDFNLLL
ncbi:hypothetical protein F4805DRAFT_474655 [Annulohypoxylon moriforme]|nr:hypothetical protein F4805DRAFT_474655 [Annulohypoxylon moriforme]